MNIIKAFLHMLRPVSAHASLLITPDMHGRAAVRFREVADRVIGEPSGRFIRGGMPFMFNYTDGMTGRTYFVTVGRLKAHTMFPGMPHTEPDGRWPDPHTWRYPVQVHD